MDKAIVKLAPSILSADFAHLGKQVGEAEQAGADRIHVDVMDGHFVPNISMGAPIVQSLRQVTRLPLETHLMISDPDFFLEEFVDAGSDSFLVHWEGNNNLHRTVQRIKARGKRVGVAINPAKIRRVRQLIEQIKPGCDLEVDGGIDAESAPLAVAAGANVLVAGTAIFGGNDEVAAAMDRLRATIKQWEKQPQSV